MFAVEIYFQVGVFQKQKERKFAKTNTMEP